MKKLLLILLAVAVVLGTGIVLVHGRKSDPKVATAAPTLSYVALGDSVAAGVGLEPYSDSSACNRTDKSYPSVVAARLRLRLTNLACSGATLSDGVLGAQTVNNLALDAQVNRLFSQPKPDFISITIGANDVQWTKFLTDCYTGNCATADNTAAVADLLTAFQGNLHTLLTQIHDHYGTAVPPVIVAGYYQVMPEQAATCSDLSGVDADEQQWSRQQQAALNVSLRQVAETFDFAHFTAPNFSGHELCAPTPWVQGLQDGAPYHPTADGQAAYADAIAAAIRTTQAGKHL